MLDASMRPKVNLDTHFFLDPDSGVYFRNNEGSFRMEGRSIHQWIEQLLPAFDGQTTLGELTDGLPDEYRQRVYQITEILYQNGFLRDVSTDFPHTLTADIIAAYQDQVAFLDHVGGSGAHRFERYRQSRVLAVGEGSMFLSLVHALLESGLPKFHVLAPTLAAEERQRLHNLAEHARKLDPDVDVVEMAVDASGFGDWQDVVKGFDAVLYVSESGDMVTLQQLEAACRHHRALLLPALCAAPLGMAGPLIHPGDAGALPHIGGACTGHCLKGMEMSTVFPLLPEPFWPTLWCLNS
ncbi:hypothetical protein GCM10025857_06270 [Alicyclobacillus contaminans]|nr:hypothetical protein GCM10025857_06270 [Alicyclobacillus contaminans]